MATKICPKCKEDSFTWSILEENPAFTNWGCYKCGYEAIENEADECVCESCGKKTKIELKDQEMEYWWCSGCNKIS